MPRTTCWIAVLLLACGDADATGGGPGGGPTGGGGEGGALEGAGGAGGASGGEGTGGAPLLCAEGLPTVSFSADVQPILTASCAKTNCHRGSLADAGLDMSEGNAYAELVDVMTTQCGGDRVRVVPNDGASSYVLDKVKGIDLCGTSKQMPPGTNPKLSAGEIEILEAWICGGALED